MHYENSFNSRWCGFMRVTLKTLLERNNFKVSGEAVNGIEGIKNILRLNRILSLWI